MVECTTCHGRYEPMGADNVAYFHACPPLSVRELVRGLADGTVVLNAASQRRVDDAKAADILLPPAPGTPSRLEIVLGSLTIERANKRDENVVEDPTHTHPGRPKAPGGGVTIVAGA